jgi:phage shock protein C
MADSGARLYRSRDERVISGVLGGIAERLGTDPSVVRIVFAVLTFFTGIVPGIVLYVIAAIIVPEEPVGGSPDESPPPALD